MSTACPLRRPGENIQRESDFSDSAASDGIGSRSRRTGEGLAGRVHVDGHEEARSDDVASANVSLGGSAAGASAALPKGLSAGSFSTAIDGRVRMRRTVGAIGVGRREGGADGRGWRVGPGPAATTGAAGAGGAGVGVGAAAEPDRAATRDDRRGMPPGAGRRIETRIGVGANRITQRWISFANAESNGSPA